MKKRTISITGIVIDSSTGKPIENVNVSLQSGKGTTTDDQGIFFLYASSKSVIVRFSHIAYEEKVIQGEWVPGIIYLTPTQVRLPAVNVSVNKVIPGVTPVSWSSMNAREIKLRYTTEDAPMVLSSETGIHAYSESGNGTGYSYLSIRGFDQSRVAILIDNVSLNDNESHQVYWVDHGDILSDAESVEIQRGIGKSLYGAAAFGGSVNVNTRIIQPSETYRLGVSLGSFNTRKIRLQYFSGSSQNLNWSGRFSLLESDGYRVDSNSQQIAGFFGAEYQLKGTTHQFRALLGREVSDLQWDGISREMTENRLLRNGKMPWTVPFTDNFFQQIYSLNSYIPVNPHMAIRNTAYLVKGSGFYEIDKSQTDIYSYNLDINNQYSDDEELAIETNLNRRKWIQNTYFGITPVLTTEMKNIRLDAGAGLRKYTGKHFGEVRQVSNETIANNLPAKFRYYDYTGEKFTISMFLHLVYRVSNQLYFTTDIQSQNHYWDLSQDRIGHFYGYQISADWNFLTPRIGFNYQLTDLVNIYGLYGTSSKEPSDVQILEADDVWDKPKTAAPEKITDAEFGFSHKTNDRSLKVNFYRIRYKNEIISDIYDFEDTDFQISTADATIHQGVEIESTLQLSNQLDFTMNGTISSNHYKNGEIAGNQILNSPAKLLNVALDYQAGQNQGWSLFLKYTGRQFINAENTFDISISPYTLINLSYWLELDHLRLSMKVNNLFDTLYETYGYTGDWGSFYWPGATRNITFLLEYAL